MGRFMGLDPSITTLLVGRIKLLLHRLRLLLRRRQLAANRRFVCFPSNCSESLIGPLIENVIEWSIQDSMRSSSDQLLCSRLHLFCWLLIGQSMNGSPHRSVYSNAGIKSMANGLSWTSDSPIRPWVNESITRSSRRSANSITVEFLRRVFEPGCIEWRIDWRSLADLPLISFNGQKEAKRGKQRQTEANRGKQRRRERRKEGKRTVNGDATATLRRRNGQFVSNSIESEYIGSNNGLRRLCRIERDRAASQIGWNRIDKDGTRENSLRFHRINKWGLTNEDYQMNNFQMMDGTMALDIIHSCSPPNYWFDS